MTSALTDVAASLGQSTKDLNSSVENAHKRHFLQTFRRWSILFKRKESSVEDDKWLVAEYYKSLGHLSAAGLEKLTDVLKEKHVFFPSIKECLDATKCDKYDWAHPFRSLHTPGPNPLLQSTVVRQLAAPTKQLGYDGE